MRNMAADSLVKKSQISVYLPQTSNLDQRMGKVLICGVECRIKAYESSEAVLKR